MDSSKEIDRPYTSHYRHPNLSPHVNDQIDGPFNGFSDKEVRSEVQKFLNNTTLQQHSMCFMKGAFISQNHRSFESIGDVGLTLTDKEKASLQQEAANRWRLPRALWPLMVISAIGAATQGWDESAINGGKTSE